MCMHQWLTLGPPSATTTMTPPQFLMKILVKTDFPFSQCMMSISTILIILYPLLLIVIYWIHHHCLMMNWRIYTQFSQRELMNCGCNCLPIKPSNPLIKKGEPSILILLKFLQQTSLNLSTTLDYMSGLLTTNLQDVRTVRIFVIVQFSKLLSKKSYTNHPMMYNKGICFVMKMMDIKISFFGLCCHTGPAMCWILSTFTALLSFIPISRSAQLSHAV